LTQITSKCFRLYTLFSSFNYYEPIQINVIQSGNYTLSSVGNLYGATGYLYKKHFNEFNPYERLITHNSDGCLQNEFKIITELQSSVTYILIIVPNSLRSTGNFSIVVSGPNNVTFNPISKFHIEPICSSFNRNFH